jgi:cytochrome d ubiquinol oxidase subunit II
VGVAVLRSDARALFDGLTSRGVPLMVVSAFAGAATVALLFTRRYAVSRLAAAVAVTAVVWGWGAGQYPYLLQGSLTVDDAAAGRTTLVAMLWTLVLGSVLLVPALVYLYALFQRGPAPRADTGRGGTP